MLADDAIFNKSTSSVSTKYTRKLADDTDTSEEDKAMLAPALHLKGLVGHPSSAQLGASAAVPMKDSSEHPEGWPSWATWSWERSYLPNAMHDSDNELLKFLHLIKSTKVSSFASAMRVALGLGMLVREYKQVIEYELDEVTPNIPSYISTLVLDIKCLDLILETVNTARGGVVHLSKAQAGKQPQEGAGIKGDGPGNIAQNAADGGQKVQGDMVERQQETKLLEEEKKKMVALKVQRYSKAKMRLLTVSINVVRLCIA
ncbi:hypothetical protein C8R48DRAFT_680060 [Suillus tomentosus]|nr:hypothetical protein C8R48DRAFT_680060 [Suillus tomentosus]